MSKKISSSKFQEQWDQCNETWGPGTGRTEAEILVRQLWNAFDNGKRKHFHDPLTGKCTKVCQACAIEKARAFLGLK